jgi:hypothetical protein
MREYLEEREEVSKRKREGWRIAILSAGLEEAFGPASNREARLTFALRGFRPFVLSYRPVTLRLQNAAERLGDYLHVQREHRASDDPWWVETRAFVERTYRELRWVVGGELLGTPLRNAAGHYYVTAVVEPAVRARISKGARMVINVEYLVDRNARIAS